MSDKISTFAHKIINTSTFMNKYIITLLSMAEKLQDALSNIWGILLVIFGFIANFFGGYIMAISAVIVCVLVDLFWGIKSAHKRHKYTQSELIKSTVSKLTAYGTALLVFIFIEKLIGFPNLPTGAVASLICVTELWSTSGNILIVNPNIPFFRILKPVLIGEIARKLNISEDQVEDFLDRKK